MAIVMDILDFKDRTSEVIEVNTDVVIGILHSLIHA